MQAPELQEFCINEFLTQRNTSEDREGMYIAISKSCIDIIYMLLFVDDEARQLRRASQGSTTSSIQEDEVPTAPSAPTITEDKPELVDCCLNNITSEPESVDCCSNHNNITSEPEPVDCCSNHNNITSEPEPVDRCLNDITSKTTTTSYAPQMQLRSLKVEFENDEDMTTDMLTTRFVTFDDSKERSPLERLRGRPSYQGNLYDLTGEVKDEGSASLEFTIDEVLEAHGSLGNKRRCYSKQQVPRRRKPLLNVLLRQVVSYHAVH